MGRKRCESIDRGALFRGRRRARSDGANVTMIGSMPIARSTAVLLAYCSNIKRNRVKRMPHGAALAFQAGLGGFDPHHPLKKHRGSCSPMRREVRDVSEAQVTS